jgi:hypothetical protein
MLNPFLRIFIMNESACCQKTFGLLVVLLDNHAVHTRGHNKKVAKQRCRLNGRAFSFPQRYLNAWNILPAYVVNASPVKVFRIMNTAIVYYTNYYCLLFTMTGCVTVPPDRLEQHLSIKLNQIKLNPYI